MKIVRFSAAALLLLVVSCSRPAGETACRSAREEMNSGHYVRARMLLEKFLQEHPGDRVAGRCYNLLGIAAWKLGRMGDAAHAFEESRRLDPRRWEASYNLGVLLARAGETERARELFEEAFAASGDDVRPALYLASLEMQAGRWKSAEAVLLDAAARRPGLPEVLTALAICRLRTTGPEAAVKDLLKALERDRRYPPALFDLALINLRWLHDGDEAQAWFRRFLEVEKSGPHAAAARRLAAAAARMPPAAAGVQAGGRRRQPPQKGAEAAAGGRRQKAESVAEMIERAAHVAADGHIDKALRLFMAAASEAKRRGDTEMQGQALERAVKSCLDRWEAHYAYGRYLLANGKASAAVQVLRQAAVLKHDSADVYRALASAAERAEEYDTALVALKKAVELDRGSADSLWRLAELYDKKLELAGEAVAAYRDFERRFPNDPRVLKSRRRRAQLSASSSVSSAGSRKAAAAGGKVERELRTAVQKFHTRRLKLRKPRVRNTRAAVQAYNRGARYQQRRDWDNAVFYYRRALENDETFVEAYYNLGTAYMERGDLDLAADAYRLALKYKPDMQNAAYNLAIIYWKKSKYGDARRWAEYVLQLKPDHARAHYLLGMILSRDPARRAEAERHYRRFLKLAPGDPAAEGVRRWLKLHSGTGGRQRWPVAG